VGPGPVVAVAPARPADAGRAGAFVSTAAPASEEPQLVAGLGPARALSERSPVQPVGSAPEAPAPPAPEPVAEPEPQPAATPVAVTTPEPASQVVAAPPKSPSAFSGAPGPSAAGVGGWEGEESEPEEGEPAEEEEEGDVEGEPGEEEGECTPPFSLAFEGVEHEAALCVESLDGQTRLYLLLDGALIEIDVP
jgi:hypothetical protein